MIDDPYYFLIEHCRDKRAVRELLAIRDEVRAIPPAFVAEPLETVAPTADTIPVPTVSTIPCCPRTLQSPRAA